MVHSTAWYLKSADGGATWSIIASGLNQNRAGVTSPTLVRNRSTLSPDSTLVDGGQGCETVDTGHGQSWYNLSAAVDPKNPNRAVFGGVTMLATSNGGASFTDRRR